MTSLWHKIFYINKFVRSASTGALFCRQQLPSMTTQYEIRRHASPRNLDKAHTRCCVAHHPVRGMSLSVSSPTHVIASHMSCLYQENCLLWKKGFAMRSGWRDQEQLFKCRDLTESVEFNRLAERGWRYPPGESEGQEQAGVEGSAFLHSKRCCSGKRVKSTCRYDL